MIEIENLEFSYNRGTNAEIKALAGISAFISKGEFVAILGHNGCGKSTLARHFNALLIPDEGSIKIDGIDTKDSDKIWDIRKKCGMVFQNPDSQMVTTVVEEEVAFGPENLGVPPQEIRERITYALKSAGIEGMEKASSNLLSGGQKQRLAIAGIIAMYPDYIVFDEATSMLDPRGRSEVLKVIKKLNKEQNITVIFITHSMEEAAEADRIIIMEQGRIALEGTPKEVFKQVEKIRRLGLDVPPITELAYELNKSGLNIPPDLLTTKEMADVLSGFFRH